MSDITIKEIKALRSITGASVTDAKKALEAADGEIEKAKQELKRLGLLVADKKSDRDAKDGVVGLRVSKDFAVIVELNCETDFVAKNEMFQKLANDILEIAQKNQITRREDLLDFNVNDDRVEDIIKENIAVLKENITLSKIFAYKLTKGSIVSGYVHNKYSEGLGKIASFVALASDCRDKSALADIARKLSVQVVASEPIAISPEELDAKLVGEQKAQFAKDLIGKPENVIEKITEGKLAKFYKDVTLLNQQFIIDPEKTVAQFITEKERELGTKISVVKYCIAKLGE